MFILNHNRKWFSPYCRYDTSILCAGVIWIDGMQSNALKELQGIKDKLQNINGA